MSIHLVQVSENNVFGSLIARRLEPMWLATLLIDERCLLLWRLSDCMDHRSIALGGAGQKFLSCISHHGFQTSSRTMADYRMLIELLCPWPSCFQLVESLPHGCQSTRSRSLWLLRCVTTIGIELYENSPHQRGLTMIWMQKPCPPDSLQEISR